MMTLKNLLQAAFPSALQPERYRGTVTQIQCRNVIIISAETHPRQTTKRQHKEQTKKKKKIKKTHLFIPAKLCLRNLPANKTHQQTANNVFLLWKLMIVLLMIYVLLIELPYRHSVTNVCVWYLRPGLGSSGLHIISIT